MTSIDGRYRIAVYRRRGGFCAHVLDVPGCMAHGASEVDAVENARAALRAYLALARALASEKPAVQVEVSP